MPDSGLQRDDLARMIWAPPLARFVFRGETAAENAAGAAFGLDFPEVLNRGASKGARGKPGGRVALRLGPDELLLIVPIPEGAMVFAAIEAACTDFPHALVEVSDRQLGFSLEGPHAADLLNAGCPLDLAPAAFPVGMATRTLFHKAEIMIWRMAPEIFRIEVARSLAPYVESLLIEATRDHVQANAV